MQGFSHQREDIGSPSEIVRNHSILKDEFILEESRPKEAFSSSDPASSISSGSLSSPSPRDLSILQPSPIRSARHDLTLSTLQEQHISTHFVVSDLLANTDGKPLIIRPHKKLRRRSDNSLSSSLESDNDELRTDKAVTRSNSLKKASERPGSINHQEAAILTSPLAVFKSQSMESILPKVQFETSVHQLPPKTDAIKSNSDSNLDSVQKDHIQTNNSEPYQSTSNKKPAQPEVLRNPAKCIKPSKKLIIEPFIGKTRPLSKTSMKNNDRTDQRQEQKPQSDAQLNSLTRNVKDSLVAGAVKPHAAKSSQLFSSGTKNKMEVTLSREHSVIKTSSVTNNASILDSRPTNLNSSLMAHEPTTKQSCRMEHMLNSEKSKRSEDVDKQKLKANILLQQLNITERECAKKGTKQHFLTGIVGEECKGKLDKSVHFKIQKNITSVVNNPSTNLCNSTEPVAFVGKSDIKSVSLEQSVHSIFCKDTMSKSIACVDESSTDKVQVSVYKNHDSVSIHQVPKCGYNSQDFTTFQTMPKCCHNHSESNMLPSNNFIYSFACKPNIQLKSVSTDPLITARFQGTNAKMNMNVAPKETHTLISTPIIVNPFEEFLQPHVKVIENPIKDVTFKVKKPSSGKILINKNIKKAVASSKKRQTTSILRQSSASKKQCARTKDLKPEKEPRPKSGRKSGKGQRCKRIEKIIENETSSESANPSTTILSGIGWQLSTSCAGQSNIEVSTDLHLYSSDSDFSLDLDENENENSPSESNYIKEEMLNWQPFHAFSEQATNSSPINVEMEHQSKPSLNTKPTFESDIPLVKQNITEDIHESFEQRDKTSEHISNSTGKSEVCLSTNSPSQDSSVSNNIVDDMLFNMLSPIPEGSSLSKSTNLVSDGETNYQEMTPLSSVPLQYTEDNKTQISEVVYITNNTSEEPLDSEHQHGSSMIRENTESKVNTKYEYTPLGKIARSQSLKEYDNTGKGRCKMTSESPSQKNSTENHGDRSEDIDEMIEEILSTNTSSMTSTLRNSKIHDTVSHTSRSHSLSESDRTLLLKMSQSAFASPFHASQSFTSKMCSRDTSNSSSDTSFSKLSLSDTGNSKQTPPPLADGRESYDHDDTSVSNKPPPSVKSSLKKEVTSKSVNLGRSASSREHRRHHNDPVSLLLKLCLRRMYTLVFP